MKDYICKVWLNYEDVSRVAWCYQLEFYIQRQKDFFVESIYFEIKGEIQIPFDKCNWFSD